MKSATISLSTGTLRRTTMRLMHRWYREEHGQDLIEYSLLAAIVSLVAVASISSIGQIVNSWYVGYDITIRTVPSGS